MKKAPRLIVFFFFLSQISLSQQSADLAQSVQLTATPVPVSNQVILSWNSYDNVDTYFVFRRKYGELSWGSAQAVLTGVDTSYQLDNIIEGELYEFKVSRSTSTGFAEGYITSGYNVENHPFERRLILLVESSISDSLNSEINMLVSDIESEGWNVNQLEVSKDSTAQYVKSKVLEIYNKDPESFQSILIFGHVPVPYSGNIGPDGHGDHVGAWPCDAYYGDINGSWTDGSVNNVSASQIRNRNVPGDGKFDQSFFPSAIELAVGRVDFANMSVFEASEIELLRRYIIKNHQFRKGQIKAPERGLIENNFGLAEGFCQNGIKNFTTFFGSDSVHFKDHSTLKTESYLWSFGAGGGNYQGAGGISNSTNFSMDSIQTVFTMLFGSYFGDWDSANNFLRAALATGTTLSNVWAGRPNWYFHPMAMGATLGECTLISQNNGGNYVTGFGARQVHIALMGDPTLKMYYPEPVPELSIREESATAILEWKASPDPLIDNYYIYRSENGGTVNKIATIPKQQNTFRDSCLVYNASYTYYVSAVQLKQNASGSFNNESAFLKTDIVIQTDNSIVVDFEINMDQQGFTFTNMSLSQNPLTYLWDFGNGESSIEDNPTYNYPDAGIYIVTLIASNGCVTDSISYELDYMVSTDDNSDELSISLYPNPAVDLLYIDCNIGDSNKEIEFYNMSSQLVYKTTINQREDMVNISSLVKGFYVMKIKMGHNDFYRGFMKI